MSTNDPNISEEEILQPMVNSDLDERSGSSESHPKADEDMYYNPERYVPIVELENHQLRKQLAEAKRLNEKLARLASEAQVAQAPPLQNAQALPPRDVHVPPRRPRGRPRKNAATRRAEQPPPPVEQPVQPRPRRGNQVDGAANPTAEAPTGIRNNRTPSEARTRNPSATQNVIEPDRANSGPSRPHNGRQPPSPIRHPPFPIRHPSPVRRDAQSTHRDRERQAGQRHGNEETAKERRGPHPMRSQVSPSQTIETRRPTGNPSCNNHATSHVSETLDP
ncbi:uncharacterized protein LOC133820132 [Humulus lupulus]|uniref:uncharacterized protein LOC133820132 n=1 Tax=Humulus lupulus TaxID=3486 RepID=UPI002B40D909|nr:uncharacterized protein LOC133820132 [Humulus lupulus]